MKKIFLKDFKRGWLVGDFEPSVFSTNKIEVAIQNYEAGHEEPNHYHKIATEITFMVSGSAFCNDLLIENGEGVIIEPNQPNIFRAKTNCTTLVIKFPSVPSDKYYI